MLDAIRAPLIFAYFSKNDWTLVKQLVDDAVLGRLFQVFEGVLMVR